MANTKVTGGVIADGAITAAKIASGALDGILNTYLTTNTYATQSYVTTAVNNLIDAAPASLDTLNELAAALNDDANFATTVTNSLATKLNLSGGTLTGSLGVGTSPSHLLHLSSASYPNFRIDGGAVQFDAGIDTGGNTAVLGTNSNHPLLFKTNGGEKMRIDSSGFVGIGLTNPQDKLDVNGSIRLRANTPNFTAAAESVVLDYVPTSIFATDPQFRLASIGSSTVAAGMKFITGTSSTLLDAIVVKGTAEVGIKMTPYRNSLDTGVIDLANGGGAFGWSKGLYLTGNNYFNTNWKYKQDGYGPILHINGNDGDFRFFTMPYGLAGAAGTPTERMRITSGGSVLIGTTDLDPIATNSKGVSLFADWRRFHSTSAEAGISVGTSSTNFVAFFYHNGTSASTVGTIKTNGSSTSYNTSSDYRLKENVVEMTGALDRVDALKPSRFNFIADPKTTVDGFLAHEVQEVVPEAITGKKDAVDEEGNPEYQGIDQSKLVPLLTAAIQELRAEIETLKSQINA